MASLTHISQAEIVSLCENDVKFVELLNKGRLELFEAPSQSEFRVYAILVLISEDGTLSLVEGANTESGYIGGSICAERSALAKLRFIQNPKIKLIGVVTDSDFPVSPGALCREYLTSHAGLDTPVVMANASGDKISHCLLGELWIHPYLYRTIRRKELIPFAQAFASKMPTVNDLAISFPQAVEVYTAARKVRKNIKNADIHPIVLTAAVLYSNGTIETSYQLNGIEYGCTSDAVTQLLHQMEKYRYCVSCGSPSGYASASGSGVSGGEGESDNTQSDGETMSSIVSVSDVADSAGGVVKPVLIVMVDQFGIAHAPFAQARSLLSEHDYGEVKVLVHDEQSGAFCLPTVDEIIPTLSHGCQLLSCSDFH